jgi:hypothetical protein
LYRFESGRALSIIVSPKYSSGGLRFFSQTLMLTDFDSGALRGLYPFDDYTFAVGSLRVVGAPFAGRIQFITDAQGNATGLMWWDESMASHHPQRQVNLPGVFHIHTKTFPLQAPMESN